MSRPCRASAQSDVSSQVADESADAAQLQQRVGGAVGVTHRIVRSLGSGGMGHVFLTEHIHLGVYAAAKIARHRDDAARQTIAHEACMLSQLEHPNIVKVLDVGQLADATPYLLMEYCNGLVLDTWLEGSGPMPPKRGLHILRQLACAVDYLHAQGMVHGDIKPSNIIVDGRARDFVKLVDFGIATRDAKRGARRGVIGTPAYMAPEQARGEVCGPAIDVYGVAALALELFTCRPPYDYTTAQDVLTAVLTEAPALPSERGLQVPGLDDVFRRGLHQDPAQRFPIASDFVDALEQVLTAAEAPARAPAPAAAPGRVRSLAARKAATAPALTLHCRSWLNRVAVRLMAGWYALSS